jgi:hypothetical protein
MDGEEADDDERNGSSISNNSSTVGSRQKKLSSGWKKNLHGAGFLASQESFYDDGDDNYNVTPSRNYDDNGEGGFEYSSEIIDSDLTSSTSTTRKKSSSEDQFPSNNISTFSVVNKVNLKNCNNQGFSANYLQQKLAR